MKNLFILLMLIVTGGMAVQADSAFLPLPEFSTPHVVVEWKADSDFPPPQVNILTRSRRGIGQTPWSLTAAGFRRASATSAVYDGTHNETVEFRLMDGTSQNANPHTLSRFDEGADLKFVRIASNIDGFTVNLGINEEEKVAGKGCLDFSFTYKELPDKAFRKDGAVGVPFNNTILSDWSQYKFLEFYFWEDIPSHADLFIVSASQEFRAPVVQFSEDGNEINQWHSIVVDLDEALGRPEERKQIKVFAILVGGQNIDLSRRNVFRLDEVNLWKTREIVKTRIDATPPTAPANIRCITQGLVRFEWEASKEDLSGIRGYSYSLSTNKSVYPAADAIIDSTTFGPIFELMPDGLIFKVCAINGAGMGSDVSELELPVSPDSVIKSATP